MEKISVWDLPEGDLILKEYLNYNPPHNEYTKRQREETGRDPSETDRGGWRGYNRVYSKYISHLKDQPLKLMEVGTHTGYGLLAWARYFSNASIYSFDTDPKCLKWVNDMITKYPEYEKVNFYPSDSRDSYQWVSLDEKFDIIIDDGDHNPKSQVFTLRAAWPFLKKGGYYFIEDISYRYTNPTCDVVAAEIARLELAGHTAVSYFHKNEGWEKVINNPEVWERYGVTENTPKTAVDFIAVIQKMR